jgi:hypothetical protein
MHGCGSLGTNVLGTGVACVLCCASIGPHISKIATEIRIVLMLRLLEAYYGFTALDDASGRLSRGIIALLKLGLLIDVANRIDHRWLASA